MGRRLTGTVTALALTALLAAGCSDDDPEMANATSSAGGQAAAADDGGDDGGEGQGEAEGEDEGNAPQEGDPGADDEAIAEECEPGPGRTVTPIDDVVIPAQSEPDFVVDEQVVDGVTLPGFTVPGFDFPEVTVDGGCIVEHDAPGGCLGAVTITDSGTIPERVIPGYEIPEVRGPDGTVLYEGHVVEEVAIDPVSVTGDMSEAVCQIVPDDGGTVWGVTRWGFTRWGTTQWGSTRWGTTVWPICVVEGECTETVNVPSVNVPSYTLDATTVETKQLETYELEGTETRVVEDEEETAYLAPADVLFEYDESELGPDAVPTLEAIVAAIEADFPDGAVVTVEGHTDNHGEEDYNQTLSEGRAHAVTDWLVNEGGIAPDAITTVGYGEAHPVAPNEQDDGSDDPEGRALNRRVVITVRPR